MDLHEALYTTRAMRRITGEPIPPEIQARILDAAVRAPSAGNTQTWRFLLVDHSDTKAKLGAIYRECMNSFGHPFYGTRTQAAEATPENPESQRQLRVMRSSDYLAENFERYLLLFAFGTDDLCSLLPALWSAMLAARGEGVGSTLTRMLAAAQPTSSTSSPSRPTRAGRWPPVSLWAGQPADGASPSGRRSRTSLTRIAGARHSPFQSTGLYGPELLVAHDSLGYTFALFADRPLVFLRPEGFGSTVFR